MIQLTLTQLAYAKSRNDTEGRETMPMRKQKQKKNAMKRIKVITFWIGVNIFGIPEYLEHVIERRKQQGKELIFTNAKKATL